MGRKKNNWYLLWSILTIAINITACTKDTPLVMQSVSLTEEETENVSDSSWEETEIYVYLCGAVENPDVYSVKEGSRVFEVIQKAGGFTEDADKTYVNQARVVADGEQIKIPTVGEVVEQKKDGINMNTASKEVLCTLPGIGESRAESIIQYREENGLFQTKEDIMKVPGIKEGMYDKIKDKIIVQ